MKLYTFYTDSHKELYEDYFKKTWDENKLDKSFDLVVDYFPQESGGNFMDEGWNLTMKKKVKYILKSIEDTWGESFIHADCDIQFFGDFKKDIKDKLEKNDLVAQRDESLLCAGFFACKSNEKTKELWEKVYNNIDKFGNDQLALNSLKGDVKTDFLDEKYFNISFVYNGVWTVESKVDANLIPKDIYIHHANWTVGVNNKIKMMNYVRENKNN